MFDICDVDLPHENSSFTHANVYSDFKFCKFMGGLCIYINGTCIFELTCHSL